ncbi:MAG: acylphosphatase [Armatimonadetes bacterium]|nr:acylphosphatase [Armatimonadota bacterium]
MNARRVVVKGKVQGVGFRAYVLRLACDRGISGEVWNRRDGAVEMIAAHESDNQLDRFVDALGGGPGLVVDVHANPTIAEGYSGEFTIGPTQ